MLKQSKVNEEAMEVYICTYKMEVVENITGTILTTVIEFLFEVNNWI